MTDDEQFEDQACKDMGACDSAPLGCSNPDYCPKNRVKLVIVL